jgi:hypothetical protein
VVRIHDRPSRTSDAVFSVVLEMRAIGYRSSAPSVPGTMVLAVYLVVGAFVAATHHYFVHLHVARQYGSAALAVLLWPLLFLGIDLHVH